MEGTRLTGLEGVNPLGFLAALGVQVLFEGEEEQPRLWWTDDVVPHAVVGGDFTVERIVEQALRTFPKWTDSRALSPGFGARAAYDAKFTLADIDRYLKCSFSGDPGSSLASAIVAQGSLDSSKGVVAKPTDLYFTAGKQRFLVIARQILGGVTGEALYEGLVGPWRYSSELPSLMWGRDRRPELCTVGRRSDELDAESKAHQPGSRGVGNPRSEPASRVRRSRSYIDTEGAPVRGGEAARTRGPFGRGLPDTEAVGALLAHATAGSDTRQFEARSKWYRPWGISQVMTATIRRLRPRRIRHVRASANCLVCRGVRLRSQTGGSTGLNACRCCWGSRGNACGRLILASTSAIVER